jgi:hypothetical protein
MRLGDPPLRRGTAVVALALIPALAQANGAAPLVRLEALPLVCETAAGDAVTVDGASIGGADVLEVWDGPIRRRIPLAEIESVDLVQGADGLGAQIEVGGQAIEGDIRTPAEGGDLMLTGREPATGAEIEVVLAGCARLYRDNSAPDGEAATAPAVPTPPVALH